MFKGTCLFQTIILGIHVSFRGCIASRYFKYLYTCSKKSVHVHPPPKKKKKKKTHTMNQFKTRFVDTSHPKQKRTVHDMFDPKKMVRLQDLFSVLEKQDLTYMPPEVKGWMDAMHMLSLGWSWMVKLHRLALW